MKLVLEPHFDTVIAVNEVTETKTKSGLELPEQAQSRPQIAKVIAIGEDVKRYKVGDLVIYKQYAATPIKDGDKEYLLFQEADILTGVKND